MVAKDDSHDFDRRFFPFKGRISAGDHYEWPLIRYYCALDNEDKIIRLTNRNYWTIEELFGPQLTELIESSRGKPTYVCDIGCGYMARSLTDLSDTCDHVHAYGIDVFPQPIKDKKANLIQFQADARKLPFKDNVFDVVYSYQLFQDLYKDNCIEDRVPIYMLISKVLKKGAMAFIDDHEFALHIEDDDDYRKLLTKELNLTDIEIKYGFAGEKYIPFIIMEK